MIFSDIKYVDSSQPIAAVLVTIATNVIGHKNVTPLICLMFTLKIKK